MQNDHPSFAYLETEWRRDAARFTADDATKIEIFAGLVARHSEPQRRYHGLGHLTALLDLMTAHAPHIAPGSPARLAIWWHDAIYDPTRRDNEELSADLASIDLIRLQAPTELIEQTADIILVTKNHWAGDSLGDGDFFLDADIAILGAPHSVYDTYAANVRQEYSFAPDDLYRAGRSAFLKSASARPRLFRTDVFETTYAAQARANMQRELASLTGPAP